MRKNKFYDEIIKSYKNIIQILDKYIKILSYKFIL